MAKLNPSLIFSMTRELSELHEIGQEMIEHIGTCKIVSWRFPDRAIKDVEIDLDSELFDTSEKYILLLELIIDRLYLIINATVEIFNSLPDLSTKAVLKLPKNVSKPSGLSFGTLISLFWKRLQLLAESKPTESSSKSMKTVSIRSSSADNSKVEIMPQNCMSCETAMKIVKSLINKVEECMNNLKLESVITGNRLKLDNNIFNMTQFDAMVLWTECIVKDFETLRIYAVKKTSENKSLTRDNEKIKQEIAEISNKLQIMENKYIELDQINTNLTSEVETTTKIKDDLLLKCNALTTNLAQSEIECKTKTDQIFELESDLNKMDLQNKNYIEQLISEHNKNMICAKSENNFWEDLYNKSKTELEQLENKIKQEQEKQQTMESWHLDNFTKQKQKITDEKQKIEEQNEKLIKEVEQLKNKIELQESEWKIKIQSLEDDKSKLKSEIKVCKEREEILIRCPDLNGPIVCEKGKQNPLQDMEEQLKANNIRAQLLLDQSTNLSRIVEKMRKLKSFSEVVNK